MHKCQITVQIYAAGTDPSFGLGVTHHHLSSQNLKFFSSIFHFYEQFLNNAAEKKKKPTFMQNMMNI